MLLEFIEGKNNVQLMLIRHFRRQRKEKALFWKTEVARFTKMLSNMKKIFKNL